VRVYMCSVLLRCAMLEQQLAWEVAKFDELVEREVLEPMKAILEVSSCRKLIYS
jgi:hypothetical protein